jgi:hypothetical protein
LFVAVAPIVAAAIQNARAHARAAAARVRADVTEARLREARQALSLVRACLSSGDGGDLDRQLARVDALLAGLPEPSAVRLPKQRVIVPAEPVRH